MSFFFKQCMIGIYYYETILPACNQLRFFSVESEFSTMKNLLVNTKSN